MEATFSDDLFDIETAPAALERLEALSSDLESQPKDWVAVLGALPPVRARLLQTVNSTYDRRPAAIGSVHQAIVYLGFNTVKQLATRLARAAAASLPRG